jgi:DNA invertase Pin-like site-specific DNA recombinase
MSIESHFDSIPSIFRYIEPLVDKCRADTTEANRCIYAAIYLRYSPGTGKFSSIDRQSEVCYAYAQSKHYQVVKVYIDPRASGTTANRPAFQEMMKDAATKLFDVVLAEEPDRLARRVGILDNLYHELLEHGIPLETVRTGEMGQLEVVLHGFLGAHERLLILHRTMKGKRQAAEAGRNVVGDCYGYRSLENGLLEVFEEQAEIVRLIFKWLREGLSFVKVCRELNSRGIPSPTGGVWTDGTIWQFLRQLKFIGWLIFGREKIHTGTNTRERTKTKVPISQWIRVYDERLRIISDEDWEAAHRAVQSRRLHRSALQHEHVEAKHITKYILSSKVVCPVCKENMKIYTTNRLHCTNHEIGICTNTETFDLGHAEKALIQLLIEFFEDDRYAQEFIHIYNAESITQREQRMLDRERAQQSIVKLQAKVESAYQLALKTIAKETAVAGLDRLQLELNEARRYFQSLPATVEPLQVHTPALHTLQASLRLVFMNTPFADDSPEGIHLRNTIRDAFSEVILRALPPEEAGRRRGFELSVQAEFQTIISPPQEYDEACPKPVRLKAQFSLYGSTRMKRLECRKISDTAIVNAV